MIYIRNIALQSFEVVVITIKEKEKTRKGRMMKDDTVNCINNIIVSFLARTVRLGNTSKETTKAKEAEDDYYF